MTAVEVAVRESAALGEGTTWDPATGRLIWVDVLGSRIHTYEPGSGRRTVLAAEQHVGAAKPRDGGLVVNLRDGVALYDADGAFSWLVRAPVPGRRGNDAAVAARRLPLGRHHALRRADRRRQLSRITPDGTATELFPTVSVSNGTGWSPDGSLVYYIDSPHPPHRRLPDGRPTPGRPAPLGHHRGRSRGFPDGLTVDADGCVWVALWDGAQLRRCTPDGDLDRTLALPVSRPTACAFGGAGLRDLYISTARTGLTRPHPLSGSLLVVPDAGEGLPGTPFGG